MVHVHFGFLWFKASQKSVVLSLVSKQLTVSKALSVASVLFLNFEMKHLVWLITKINTHGSKANPQMCWKSAFLAEESGAFPKRMPLVLGWVEFMARSIYVLWVFPPAEKCFCGETLFCSTCKVTSCWVVSQFRHNAETPELCSNAF